MREVARREGVRPEQNDPSLVLKTLYSVGLVSRKEYDRLRKSLRVRNAVVHGLRPADPTPEDVTFLVACAKRLLRHEPTEAGA
jgi:hypothetical protein